jgi:hypothetical protein
MSPYSYEKTVCNNCKTKMDEKRTSKYNELWKEWLGRCNRKENICSECGRPLKIKIKK